MPGRGFVEASITASDVRIDAQVEAGFKAQNAALYAFLRGGATYTGNWAATAGLGVRF